MSVGGNKERLIDADKLTKYVIRLEKTGNSDNYETLTFNLGYNTALLHVKNLIESALALNAVPESRYPTWKEWHNMCFKGSNFLFQPCMFVYCDKVENCCNGYDCMNQPIPADVAWKLGIKPIKNEPERT